MVTSHRLLCLRQEGYLLDTERNQTILLSWLSVEGPGPEGESRQKPEGSKWRMTVADEGELAAGLSCWLEGQVLLVCLCARVRACVCVCDAGRGCARQLWL